MSCLWDKGEGTNIKRRNMTLLVFFSKSTMAIFIPNNIFFYLHFWNKVDFSLSLSWNINKDRNKWTVSIFYLWKFQVFYQVFLFLFWLFSYVAFYDFFFFLLYTVNNIFLDVAEMPPLWVTRPQNYKGREYLQGLVPMQSSFPQVLLLFGDRFISAIMTVFVFSVFLFLFATAALSQVPWGPPPSTSEQKQRCRETERSWFLSADQIILIPMVTESWRGGLGREKGLGGKRKIWEEQKSLGVKRRCWKEDGGGDSALSSFQVWNAMPLIQARIREAWVWALVSPVGRIWGCGHLSWPWRH